MSTCRISIMRKTLAGLILAPLVLPIVVVLASAAQDQSTVGKEAYQSKCAMCHGKDAKGDTKAGKMTKTPDLTQTPWKFGTALADVEKLTREGAGKMPGFAEKLTPEEITAVSTYTRDLSDIAEE